jgi:RimJ/RimL family protein N-acetyltransferase
MTCSVLLREVIEADLPIFFEQHLDEEANDMAAFTAKGPTDREAFMAHWTKIPGGDSTTIRTILFEGQVAGSVLDYEEEAGRLEVSYWLGKPYCGKGIATEALRAFLLQIQVRPLYARAAKDNRASLRVLEKCGFIRLRARGWGLLTRGKEIEEFLLRLD